MSAALLVVLPGVSAAQRLELDGRIWFPEVTAEAKIEGGSSPGTRLDFVRDLGIDDEPLPDLRLSFFTGPNSKLRLGYTLARYEGRASLGQTIEFNGTAYPAAARVVSDLDVHYARLGWIWQPALIPDTLRVGPVLEAKAFVVDATLAAPAAGLRERESLGIVIPTIGVALDLTVHRMVELFAEVSGLTIGDPGHVVDAEAGLRFTPNKLVTLTGGYRFLDVRGEEDRSFARLRLAGPFLGLRVRF